MSTQVRDPVVTGERKVTGGRNWIVVLVVGLLAAVVGLGVGYVAFSPSSDSEGAADVQTLLDDYVAAANAGDADAVLALFTDDAQFFGYTLGEAPESVVRNFIESADGTLEGPNNLVVAGEFPRYRASSTLVWGDDNEFLYVYKFDQADGKLLISYLNWVGNLGEPW